jgi:asparagine synthase (glutamine-hydrolysing)
MNLSLDPAAAYANTLSICRPPLRQRLLSPHRRSADHQPEQLVREAFVTDADDPLRGMIAADIAVMLPDDFLTKVDRASMAVGLEVRPPLVDHELLELAARIPSRWKIRNGETKFIFKQLLRNSVPASILDRPKQGFDIPVDQWLRGPLREMFESSVLDRSARMGDFIDQSVARNLYQAHQRGLGRHGNALWSLLIFGRWAEKHLSPPSTDSNRDSGAGDEASIVASSRPSPSGL